MANESIIELDGVGLTDAGLFAKDCAFPITNMEKNCPNDPFVLNIPVFMGEWADAKTVPVIDGRTYNIDTTGVENEACDTPTLKVDLTGCEFIAPNMRLLDLKTDTLEWTKLVEKVCRMRGVNEAQLGQLFDNQGNFIPENPYTPDFVSIAMTALGQALSGEIAYSAARGDVANDRQFDGFLTQILGWDLPGVNACAATMNARQVINWATLTGVASPSVDDTVAAGQTVTLWGTVYNVTEGWNLAQFLENLYIPAVNNTWANRAGGVTMWEMLVRSGTENCLLDSAACMQPCGLTAGDIDDPELRNRFAQFRNSRMGKLYPSNTPFTMKPSAFIASNRMYFGPREIGGNVTYGLFFRNIARVLSQLSPMSRALITANGSLNQPNALLKNRYNHVAMPFEDSVVQWDMRSISARCIAATVLVEVGMMVLSRHLWLEIQGVVCNATYTPCIYDIVVDDVPLPMPS